MGHTIYMDNAATTRVAPEVLTAMLPFFKESYGNPSSIYGKGGEAKKAVDGARAVIAEALGAKPSEIFFTGSGTEADNWALVGVCEAYADKGRHIITSAIEHHAILHTCEYLEKRGCAVSYVPVDENGIIRLDELEKAIRPETVLISVGFANNEIGTIQPIREISELAKKNGVLFHTDAVQVFGQLPINVDECGLDLLSASAHKLNGPKGVGFLYIRNGLKLKSFIHGGAQERGRRAGTENVAGIVGFGAAVKRAMTVMEEKNQHLTELRDYLMARIEEEIDYCRLNGDRTRRLPVNVNFSFQFIEGESLLIMLDMKGIAASSGSACTSGSLDPSHVLLAIGLPHEIAHGSLRLTLGADNTREEADTVVMAIKEIVAKLRNMSPLYEDFMKNQGR
ncbi:MAG: cysteine desulfurase NifS [Lachnospiraceae bacterium]|jgi:cysteine desulfurase|nr:cysteine desulfurase NifS [Lachnospiraceae bacterium]